MLMHIIGFLPCLGIIASLILWIMKKDTSRFIDDQGREAVNFQLSIIIVLVAITVVTMVVHFLSFLSPIVGLASLILAIMGGLKANEGVAYRYPFNFRLIK